MHVVEIDLTSPGISFFTTPSNGPLPGEVTGQKTRDFLDANDLQVAINGGFYTLDSQATNPDGTTVIYRNVVHLAVSAGEHVSPFSGNGSTHEGAINISPTNVPQLISPANVNNSNFTPAQPNVTLFNTVGGNEQLIRNGVVVATDAVLHPRSAMGYKPGKLFLFAVDGRQSGYSEGMTTIEMANLLKNDYGITNALNLDGGGSTTLAFGYDAPRVMNRPSDGFERTVGNNFGVHATPWPQWWVDADGTWSGAANWSGGVPDAPGAVASFKGAISAPRTVTVDSDMTVGTLNFENASAYTLAGTRTIRLDSTSGPAAINVLRASNQTINAPIALSDPAMINVATGANLTIGETVRNAADHALTKTGGGILIVNAPGTLRTGALTISEGRIRLSPGGNKAIRTTSLDIAPAARMNLYDNDLVVDYAGASPIGQWNGTAYTGVTGLIATGRNGGAWDGNGIITSMTDAAAATQRTTLAIVEASAALDLSGSETRGWNGLTVDATSVLVMYTYTGDADVNGVIDGDDYFRIDSNITKPGATPGYFNGDFNLDGVLSGDDYLLIDANFDAQGAPPAELTHVSAVPEPVAALWGVLPALLSVRTRRRR